MRRYHDLRTDSFMYGWYVFVYTLAFVNSFPSKKMCAIFSYTYTSTKILEITFVTYTTTLKLNLKKKEKKKKIIYVYEFQSAYYIITTLSYIKHYVYLSHAVLTSTESFSKWVSANYYATQYLGSYYVLYSL